MSADPDIADASLAPGWTVDDLAMLDELARMGLDMARALSSQAVAHAEAVQRREGEILSPAEASSTRLAFERVARSVRLSLALKAMGCGEDAGAPTCRTILRLGDGEPSTAAKDTDTEERPEPAERAREREREYEILTAGSRDDALERLCADLGITPEWRDDPEEPGRRRLHVTFDAPASTDHPDPYAPPRSRRSRTRPPALAG